MGDQRTPVREVRAAALAAARQAAHRGFSREPNADFLLRRAWVAALRSIGRSGHPRTAQLVAEWTRAEHSANDLDLRPLPTDGAYLSFERRMTPESNRAMEDLLDALVPWPDEPDAVSRWRELGIAARCVLSGRGSAPFTVSRISLDGRDRWHPYWGGGAQDGNWDLRPPVSANRAVRRRETDEWLRYFGHAIGGINRLEVDADQSTFHLVRSTVADLWPEAIVTRRQVGPRLG